MQGSTTNDDCEQVDLLPLSDVFSYFFPNPICHTPSRSGVYQRILLPRLHIEKRPSSFDKGRSALGLGTVVLVHADGLEPTTR